MAKKEVCEECENNEAIFKCVSCEKYLCEDCANDNHICLNNALDNIKDSLYIDIEEVDMLETD